MESTKIVTNKAYWHNHWLWQKSMAWVHPDKKIAYYNIGKCASSSMKQSLEAVGFKRSDKFTQMMDFKTFTIIREPISRFVSGMFSVLANQNSRRKSGDYHPQFFGHQNIYEVVPIFIEEIEKNGFFDDHILPQIYTISDVTGRLYRLDMIVLFENLNRDLQKIRDFIGEDITIKHINGIDEYRMFLYCVIAKSIKQLKYDVTGYIMSDSGLMKRIERLYTRDIFLYSLLVETIVDFLRSKI